jgi:O-acetylhomoserine/O-acetylserine sulfhydrylase-like pyridoxal-dependent enzyme
VALKQERNLLNLFNFSATLQISEMFAHWLFIQLQQLHSQLSPAEQLEAGVTPGLVRLSLGLENIDDIKADLEAGFKAAKG